MSVGGFTFSSMARLTDYRNSLTASSNRRAEAASDKTDESNTSARPVDSRTAQAMLWGGLTPSDSTYSGFESISSSFATSAWNYSPSTYKAPDLDLSYNFLTLQKVFSYRDAVLARNSGESSSVGQNLSESS